MSCRCRVDNSSFRQIFSLLIFNMKQLEKINNEFNNHIRFETIIDWEDTEPDTLEKKTLRHWKSQKILRNNPQIFELLEYGYVITKRENKPKKPITIIDYIREFFKKKEKIDMSNVIDSKRFEYERAKKELIETVSAGRPVSDELRERLRKNCPKDMDIFTPDGKFKIKWTTDPNEGLW